MNTLKRMFKRSVSPSRGRQKLNSNPTLSVPSSSTSHSGSSSLQRSVGYHTLPKQWKEGEELNKKMFETLKVRKEALEGALLNKLAELKALCLKEGELTGELPPETPVDSNGQMPQIRRRVGTAFTFDNKFLLKPRTKEEEIISKLELEYEIQSKIVSAAGKLAKDTTAKKIVRKQRKQAFQQAMARLKDLESKLLEVKRKIVASRRRQSTEDLSEDNISHSTDKSQEKCETTLSKFFVTEVSYKQMLLKRSASLYSCSVPSIPNNLSSDNTCPQRRPMSPQIVRERVNLIPRPRSAAAKCEPTFDYDTDEESNELLRNLEDNCSSNDSTTGGTNSVIFIGEDKHKPISRQSPFIRKYETPLNDASNLCTSPNVRNTFPLSTQDDSRVRHPTTSSIKDNKSVVNRNHKNLQNEDNPQLLRSNSLDNNHRKGATTQASVESHSGLSSPSNDSHHKHYLNHYPSYRVSRTKAQETGPMSPTPVQQSCHLAQRPLPTLPVSDINHNNNTNMKSGSTMSANHSSNRHQMSPRIDTKGYDVTDSSSGQTRNHKNIQNSRFNFEETNNQNYPPMSPRSNTPSKMLAKTSAAVESQATNRNTSRNTSPYPLPSTPKTRKTWTETSLNFVLPAKTSNKSTSTPENMTTISGPNVTNRTNSNRTPIPSNVDKKEELYVNVTPFNVNPTQSPPLSFSPPAKKLPSQSTPPMCSPQPAPTPTPSQTPFNRNSSASSTQSLGGDFSSKPPSIPLSPTIKSGPGVEVTVVSVGHFQPYWEEEKPFEMDDFFKYSRKHRTAQQASSPVVSPPPIKSNGPSHHLTVEDSPSVDISPKCVQSLNSSLLNDSFKAKVIVSDGFKQELMDWYEDRKGTPNTNNTTNNNNNDKKNPTLV